MSEERLKTEGRLAPGFAAAAMPVSAETITTDTEGLEAGEIKVPSGDLAMPAYRAMPAKEGKFPVVLVVQEIFGVHEHIRDICRRLAKEGYFAIAPELYVRQGDPSSSSDVQELIQKIVSKVPDAQVMADLDATVAYVEQTGRGDLERLAITGFCWGGRITWLYSAHQPKIKAGGAWYGRVMAGPYTNDLTPQQAVDVARHLHGAMLGQYGGKDESIPIATLQKMRDALVANGTVDWEIVVYPKSGHAFFADYRDTYNEKDAQAGWAKLLEWFAKHGVV